MNNIVFTIVAKNYLPLARALGWSIANNNKTPVKFFIFLADEPDDSIDLENKEELIIPVSKIGIENLTDWAFKYNVTEFCTSVKPSCFKYLFNVLGAEKVIYFDPDIFVFNDLECIFNSLNRKQVVVTPHYLTPQINYTGDQKEANTLFVGIFNFGFVAFKKTSQCLLVLDWWENRLSNQCYADKNDALHTDQKWGDFFPVYFNQTLEISPSLGFNLAPWNLFEREIFIENEVFKVRGKYANQTDLLTFVHFAGFDPNNLKLIHKDFWDMDIEKYPDYDLARKIYVGKITEYKFNEYKNRSYTYCTFSNGIFIQEFQRRLYRSITENGKIFDNPFSSDGNYYKMLKKHNLLSKVAPKKINRKTYNNLNKKLQLINTILKFVCRLIRVDRYFLLLKFLNRYSRFENQAFLLDEKTIKIY